MGFWSWPRPGPSNSRNNDATCRDPSGYAVVDCPSGAVGWAGLIDG
ncbi:hypothetical protein [Pyrobaculum sp.]